MDSYSDQSINLDEIIFQLPSFIKMQEDGITEEEIAEKKIQVISLLNTLGSNLTSEQVETFRDLLLEIKKLQEQETGKDEGNKTKREERLKQEKQVVAMWKKLKKSTTSDHQKQINQLLGEVNVPKTKIRKEIFLNSLINEITFLYRKSVFLFVSVAIALFINLATFFRDNNPYSCLESLDALSYLKFLPECMFPHNALYEDCDDVCFVDVSHYPMLVPDTNDVQNGKDVVTDRSILINFLQLAETLDFKLLFLDLYFDNNSQDSLASALAMQLQSMVDRGKNIIVCQNTESDENPDFSIFSHLNGYVPHLINSSQTRSINVIDGRESVPLIIYNALYGQKGIPQKWYTPFDSIFPYLSIPYDLISYRNCPLIYIPFDTTTGEDECVDICDSDIAGNINGKDLIIVGNMVEGDLHSTYARSVSGPFLTYLQYKSLSNNVDVESSMEWWGALVFYSLLVYLRLWYEINEKKREELDNKISLSFRKKTSAFMSAFFFSAFTSFIGYSIVFGLISYLLLYTCGIVYSTFVPAFVFTMLEWSIKCNKIYKKILSR